VSPPGGGAADAFDAQQHVMRVCIVHSPNLIKLTISKRLRNLDAVVCLLSRHAERTQMIEDWNARAKDATKDAGESLTRLAKPSSMVTGRMGCPVAVNGAPDCKAGADKLCQSKGYKEGKSLDTDAAEKCSPKVFIPGRQREPGDCKTENYVTRALCQ